MDDDIARLIHDLARPIFNYRMASGLLSPPGFLETPMSRGAEKRQANAEREIIDIVADYAHRVGLT